MNGDEWREDPMALRSMNNGRVFLDVLAALSLLPALLGAQSYDARPVHQSASPEAQETYLEIARFFQRHLGK
jgi:hypothetical protein